MKAQLKSKLNPENRSVLQDIIPLETPFLLYVDPSSACNFKCEFCPTGHVDLVRGANYKRRVLSLELFEKFVRDLEAFSSPIRVLRMNKIGEPLLNKHLPQMIRLAKESGRVGSIDLATNASLFTPVLLEAIIDAGLDRLNISLEGINAAQYRQHAKVEVDFEAITASIRWLHNHRGHCEITIKAPEDYLNDEQKKAFFDTFGNYCDRIFLERLSPIWPGFDMESRVMNFVPANSSGQYGQKIETKQVCTYIFYAMALNADGTVSACCPDWGQKLVVGDLHDTSLKEIWNSPAMHALRLQHLKGRRHDNEVCRNCGHIAHSQIDDIDPWRESLLENYLAHFPEASPPSPSI
ncbi:radical SAM/SPASM domain-containing protein [Ferribacterium limneticum]|uniref:radical SAM/SPASM domain-containing protein n=1 Tax=Ferribacterium limneticum TaxID=76259 RepID=UPI001CF8EC5C|nr:radical SAM/SPASM domain-containing protein [Ferribacterium limneticum]UCV23795.1 SPASM domain-containing protein [Ferribacterium limneticum]